MLEQTKETTLPKQGYGLPKTFNLIQFEIQDCVSETPMNSWPLAVQPQPECHMKTFVPNNFDTKPTQIILAIPRID